jgi:hypothetical protein
MVFIFPQMDEMTDISTILSGNLAPGSVTADPEEQQALEEELDALMKEANTTDNNSNNTGAQVPLPAAPTKNIPAVAAAVAVPDTANVAKLREKTLA